MADAADTPLTTSAVLMSASRHISKKCGAENRAFLECKKADENPAACLKQGKEVTTCVISLSVPTHDLGLCLFHPRLLRRHTLLLPTRALGAAQDGSLAPVLARRIGRRPRRDPASTK